MSGPDKYNWDDLLIKPLIPHNNFHIMKKSLVIFFKIRGVQIVRVKLLCWFLKVPVWRLYSDNIDGRGWSRYLYYCVRFVIYYIFRYRYYKRACWKHCQMGSIQVHTKYHYICIHMWIGEIYTIPKKYWIKER